MRTTIDTLKAYGFDLLEVDLDKEMFLMKQGKVCVYYMGNGAYEIFKHAQGSVCYSQFILNGMTHITEILTKVKHIHGLQ